MVIFNSKTCAEKYADHHDQHQRCALSVSLTHLRENITSGSVLIVHEFCNEKKKRKISNNINVVIRASHLRKKIKIAIGITSGLVLIINEFWNDQKREKSMITFLLWFERIAVAPTRKHQDNYRDNFRIGVNC